MGVVGTLDGGEAGSVEDRGGEGDGARCEESGTAAGLSAPPEGVLGAAKAKGQPQAASVSPQLSPQPAKPLEELMSSIAEKKLENERGHPSMQSDLRPKSAPGGRCVATGLTSMSPQDGTTVGGGVDADRYRAEGGVEGEVHIVHMPLSPYR